MDKNAIKKYAIWARRELIARVSQKAQQYGISEEHAGDIHAESVNGRLLTEAEQAQRTALILHIHQEGFRQVMEEVAYTWFNRFIALRFMEVNNYLPTRIRVFTDEDNAFKPQILAEAIHMEMDGLDREKVYAFKEKNQTEELYKYLFITQCNALSVILPGMFQQIEDYTELLLPDNLLREGSVIEQMIALIPEEDWQDQVQIIGWLYQYYNTELNELVYDGSMSKSRIEKDLLPAATTIYTPDWAVRYMVENSLGRLWVEGHPDDALKAGWRYYLEEAEQEPEVQAQLAKLRAEYAAIKPEDIKCIDPCMGSGHILVYMFDVLVQIYEAYGYSTREAVQSILENNLYGLDIDDRAAQLAYFAVMMKARQYDRRFFTRGIQPHVCAIQESAGMPEQGWGAFGAEEGIARRIHAAFVDAKEYGSLICPDVTPEEIHALRHRMAQMQGLDPNTMSLGQLSDAMAAIDVIAPLVEQTEMLCRKYDVVVTNPPYLGSSRFSPALDKYVKDNFSEEKADLSAVMYRRAIDGFAKKNGFVSFITTSSWMFLSSFEKLRKYAAKTVAISSLVDFGTELFDGKVGHNPIVSWVSRKAPLRYVMTAIRLVDYCYSRRDEKETKYFDLKNRYTAQQDNFSKIPGAPVAYWVSDEFYAAFSAQNLGQIGQASKGIITGDNNRFLRNWWEVDNHRISYNCHNSSECITSRKRWFPCCKGGERRKWYGNMQSIINWENNGYVIMNNKDSGHHSQDYYDWMKFIPIINWSSVSSGKASFRQAKCCLSEHAGMAYAPREASYINYALGFMNSIVSENLLGILSPTLNYNAGEIGNLPIIIVDSKKENIDCFVSECIDISQNDWDSFETSWDFQRHPLVENQQYASNFHPGESDSPETSIHSAFTMWQATTERRFQQIKSNEEELNRIFIDIYGLQDELTPEVEEKDVTVRRADLGRDVRSFISYAVGCMFGRYSLDVEGLVYAGGNFDAKYCRWMQQFGDRANEEIDENGNLLHGGWAGSSMCAYDGVRKDGKWVAASYPPDADNIIPITDDEYFDDDIVGRFVQFVETVYGRGTLEENLKFIADALGGTGTPRQVIRSYFLNDFYADHLKIYQKRPIYWLFDSGRKNGFKCLIYMHRYASDTIARIRTDYVHEQQSRYRTAIADLEKRAAAATTAGRVKLTKQLTKIKAQAEELRIYEEKIHHLADQMIAIDLDDGVKVNYSKFGDVLARIK